MQYGLTMRSQERLHRAVTQRLSPTISFDDVYLALVLDDMEREPRPGKYDENGKRVPVPLPHFENGMHHERVFDPEAKVNPRYISFAPETELRQNYLQRDVKSGKSGKQFLGNHFKGKMKTRQPLSLLAFAIQHGKPLTDATAKAKMLKLVDDAPTQLGVANVQKHKTVFDPMHPRFLLSTTMLQAKAENEGAFLGTMYDACHQQPQAGFPLVQDMRSQSQLHDAIIIVTNKCVRPRPKNEADPWDAAGELHCTVFAAVDSVGRPLLVRTVASPEDWNQRGHVSIPTTKSTGPECKARQGDAQW